MATHKDFGSTAGLVKNSNIRDELNDMKGNERKTVQHKFELTINKNRNGNGKYQGDKDRHKIMPNSRS